MAIHPSADAPQNSHQAASTTQPIDIQAWTEETTAAMDSMAISAIPDGGSVEGPAVQRTTISLQIPLDEHAVPRSAAAVTAGKETGQAYFKRKEPLRRDSLKRREALLKGKEGSRRRNRWENDRLINNPYVEPPQPRDWEIRPTYPVQHVPYYLAPLWDAGLAARSVERKARAAKAASKASNIASRPSTAGVVPKELREKLKRSRGAKGLLMDLESEVREFVEKWEEKERAAEKEGIPVDLDSEDEEIVFVGRNGKMSDLKSPCSSDEIKRELMLFESPEGEPGASFGRWLVHHIGTYYGLHTWSVTTGNPARREAYIGLKDAKLRSGRSPSVCSPLPRPLWGMV